MASVFKVTMLFQYTSGISTPTLPSHRTGGWSEGFYSNLDTISQILNKANGTVPPPTGTGGGGFGTPGTFQLRAALLPLGSSLKGCRIQRISPIGPAQSFALNLPGREGVFADVPQMALLCKAVSTNGTSIRRFTIRGIPDAVVTEGEYQPSQSYQTAVLAYLASLADWGWYPNQQAALRQSIFSITQAGVVTLNTGPVPFAPGNAVRISKALDSDGNFKSQNTIVTAVGPGINAFTVIPWSFGDCKGGTVNFQKAPQFVSFDPNNTVVDRSVVRKVGRPSGGYRGRRSKRRA